jgi:hypothetical protein
MRDGFGVEHLLVSKALGGSSLSNFDQKHKRDENGRFSTVERRGRQAIAAGKKGNSKFREESVELGRKLQARGHTSTGKTIEEHPYLSATAGAAALVFGQRKAFDAFMKGRLIFAKTGDISRVADNIKPTREYNIGADQAEATGEMLGNMMSNPKDIPLSYLNAIKFKTTGRTQMPRVRYEGEDVIATNTQGRMFRGNRTPITDLNDAMEYGSRPYSQQSLRMMQGNSAGDTLRTVEKRLKGNNHESAFVVVDGELVSGMNGSWVMTGYSIPEGLKLRGKTVNFTHNHPPIVPSQSRSFSPGDFNVLTQIVRNGASKNSTLRAVYADGTTQEIVITDWGKFQRFNRVMQGAITGKYVRDGGSMTSPKPSDLLDTQAQIQSAAQSGNFGFKIAEHTGFAKGRIMSDAEIRRRKKAQGHLSQTTGALGLTSLGAFGASKLPGAKVLTKTPTLRRIGASKTLNRIDPKKAKDFALGTSTAGAGIGGAGSFNFAAYTNAESRKRGPNTKVKKSFSPFEDGFAGTEGSSEVILEEISKLGSPKVKMQEIDRYERRGDTTTHIRPDTQTTYYKGKSLILRRPKYQAVVMNQSKKPRKGSEYSMRVTPNTRIDAKHAKTVHEAYQGKKKKIDYGNGSALKHEIGKSAASAFGVVHD